MKPELNIHGLSQPRPWEYALRFLFGGAVAVVASLVSRKLGDFGGGLALAFPAILPAALTLVKQHDGRQQAADDARGACLGAIALAAFALVVLLGATSGPATALPLAMLAWVSVATGAWWLSYGRH